MADEPSGGGGVTPNPPSPVTGTPGQSGVTPATTPALAQEDALKRIADLERSLGNAKEENDRHSKRLSAYEKAEKEAEAAKKAAEDAQKTELERIKEQHQEAEARELIAPVVERKLEYDKDGEPTNLEAVLDELIKGNPYLVKPAEPAPSPAQTATPPATPAIPAMNPGRSSIPGPGANPTGKPTRLSDLEWSR